MISFLDYSDYFMNRNVKFQSGHLSHNMIKSFLNKGTAEDAPFTH